MTTGNKRNYETIIKILSTGEILTSREVYERFLNVGSITRGNRTKPKKHMPTYKTVQNLLSASPKIERVNPNTRENAKWKLREQYES
mgnify:CR=1 FL=1